MAIGERSTFEPFLYYVILIGLLVEPAKLQANSPLFFPIKKVHLKPKSDTHFYDIFSLPKADPWDLILNSS